MTDRPAEVWDSGQAYEPYVGRWSRLIAARFLRSIPARPLAAWCDVGCGTGALAHAILNSENPEPGDRRRPVRGVSGRRPPAGR